MNLGFSAVMVVLSVILAVAVPVAAVWLIVKVLNGLGFVLGGFGRLVAGFFRRVASFVSGTVVDTMTLIGSVLTAGFIAPLAVVNVVLGRWSTARHYGRALEEEFTRVGLCSYRLAIGNPVRLLGLETLTEGVERRLPDLIGHAPGPEPSKKRRATFAGYEVKGSLPSGGSGARLYLAQPDADRLRSFQDAGHPDPGQVVIKSFALEEGSTLPQIVRESRALECASKLGLVLEHQLSPTSFFYVMPYVPGESLDTVTRRLHEKAGSRGLDDGALAQIAAYGVDLLGALDRFHAGGLWHKDIKPSNVIVSGHQAHLVDLGLVTPLASALTLTTHGTEYYRDPEMVRLAMQGVKVHEVDGVKFDVYSVGAVLFSMIENDFPAQGNLSRITRRCPDALKMIVRRAMAEMNTRYSSASAMLEDLRVVLRAADPFSVPVAALPSMGGQAPRQQRPGGAAVPPMPAYPASLDNLDRPTPSEDRASSGRGSRRSGPASPRSWAGRPAARRASRAGKRPGHRVGRSFFLSLLVAFLILPGLGFIGLVLTATPVSVHTEEGASGPTWAQMTRNAGIRVKTLTNDTEVSEDIRRIEEYGRMVESANQAMESGLISIEEFYRIVNSHDPENEVIPVEEIYRLIGDDASDPEAATLDEHPGPSAEDEPHGPWDRHLFTSLGGPARTVLVVEDLRSDVSSGELEQLREALEHRGHTVRGLDPYSTDSFQACAEARMAVGIHTVDSPATRDNLQRFLDERTGPDVIDGVLWVVDDSESRIPFLYVERGRQTTGEPDEATAQDPSPSGRG